MGNWQFPPDGGRMEKAEGLYLHTMNMTLINARLKTNDLILTLLAVLNPRSCTTSW